MKIVTIFKTWLQDNKIYISSNYSFKEKLIVKFKEKYTGLPIYKTETQFSKGVEWWYRIGPSFDIINGIYVEIYNDTDLLYQEDYDFGNNIKINLDKQICYDKSDSNAWAPFYEVFIKNEYESDLVKLENDDIVVDLGANIGMFTLFAAQKAKHVYAVEPLPESYSNLKRNVESLNNVTTIDKAVFSKGTEIEFNKNEISGASSIFNKRENYEKLIVQTISFENFIKQYNIDRINYLKVDIEGAEFDLFENINESYLENNIDKIFMEVHIMNSFNLDSILNKIDKYFHYNIESENTDRKGIKLYSISCKNKMK